MSDIHKGNFFGVPHPIVTFKDANGEKHYPLGSFTASELKVILVLYHMANRLTKTVIGLGDADLSIMTCVSIRQLVRARAALCEKGLIRTRKRLGNTIDYEITPAPELAQLFSQQWQKDTT
jgi:hypothetical protein